MSVILAHNRGESSEEESRAALVCDGSTNVEGSDTCFKTILHFAGVFTSLQFEILKFFNVILLELVMDYHCFC